MISSFFLSIWTIINRHRWKTFFAIIALLSVAGVSYAILKPTKPEYITELSKRGDLRQTVEVVGTVISDRDLQLQFRNPGLVSQVLVKEGDVVSINQKLASLRSEDLTANVAAATARVKEAEASLKTLKEGDRPEDIAILEQQLIAAREKLKEMQRGARPEELAIAQTQLENAKRSLADVELELKNAEEKTFRDLATVAQKSRDAVQLTSVTMDKILSSNLQEVIYPIRYPVDKTCRLQFDTVISNRITDDCFEALFAAEALKGFLVDLQNNDEQTLFQRLQETNQKIGIMRDFMINLLQVVNSTISIEQGMPLDESLLNSYKSSIATGQTELENVASQVNVQIQSLQSQLVNNKSAIDAAQNKVNQAENTVLNLEKEFILKSSSATPEQLVIQETQIRQLELQIEIAKKGARQSDIDAAEARLHAARAELTRAMANLSDSVINAPSNGRITKVNLKVGEITPSGPAMSMLGESPYRIEIFASEIDIPKVKYEQPATIELDAFPDVHYKLRVAEIDESQSIIDGVAKYRVKLDFVHPHDEFKLGMTGDTTIVTDQREDIIFIPSRAVLQDGERKYARILMDDHTTVLEKEVETGMEGEDGYIEIVSGLKEGENVILLMR